MPERTERGRERERVCVCVVCDQILTGGPSSSSLLFQSKALNTTEYYVSDGAPRGRCSICLSVPAYVPFDTRMGYQSLLYSPTFIQCARALSLSLCLSLSPSSSSSSSPVDHPDVWRSFIHSHRCACCVMYEVASRPVAVCTAFLEGSRRECSNIGNTTTTIQPTPLTLEVLVVSSR